MSTFAVIFQTVSVIVAFLISHKAQLIALEKQTEEILADLRKQLGK